MQTYTRTTPQSPPHTARLPLLDVLRGVAILGTLATNIWIFTDPQGIIGLLNAPVVDPRDGVTAAVEWLAVGLSNGKFLGLLTLMFGVGMEIQRRTAVRRGQRWPGRYPWRAALLLLDGLLHYILVVEFDILMGYAVTALIACLVLGRPARVERVAVAVAVVVHLLLITSLTLLLLSVGPAPQRAVSTLYTDGSWLEQVQFRLTAFPVLRAEAVLIVPMAFALFLWGAWLFRGGAFGMDDRGRMIRRRLLVLGLGAGLPVDLALSAAGEDWFLVQRYLTAPLVSLGYLGLVGALLERGLLPTRALSAVGRTALSCYVLTNLVASALFYGWGLGLAAHLGDARPWWTLLAAAGIGLLVASVAQLWLHRYSRGPLEALTARAYARLSTG